MKRLKNIFLLALTGLCLGNCERDDICAQETSTTPRLILEFYDITNQDQLLSVPAMTVYADDPDIPVPETDNISGAILIEPFESSRLFNLTTNIAKPPLFVGEEGVSITRRYVFERRTDLRLDADPETSSNTDIIEITYIPEYVYVSRACGYKSIFTNLRIEVIQDGDNWILGTEFNNEDNTDNITVENENATHINIFH
jgi:hypothetical protein